jgi:hypothetical protein
MKPKDLKQDLEADFDPEAIQEAAEEITDPGVEPPPELSLRTEKLTEWDETIGSTGTQAPKVRPEDENSISEELVEDGIESADRDRRLAAEDPDYEA